MARFRLSSTDIFSPINTDISLNNVSQFSFGSLSATPDYGKKIESPEKKLTKKDSNIDSMEEKANAYKSKISDDLFSPVNTDISLNNISQFSFGSLSATPDYSKKTKSPEEKYTKMDSNIDLLTMKETANAFKAIVNDDNTQSDISAEKEERFKESYKVISQSLDELFYKKPPDFSILSPISKGVENSDYKITDKVTKNSQNIKLDKKTQISERGARPKISSKIIEKTKKESTSSINKQEKSNLQLKNICPSKVSVEKKPTKNHIEDKSVVKLSDDNQKKSSKTASSNDHITKLSEGKELLVKNPTLKNETKDSRTIKGFQLKTQQKIKLTKNSPIVENENLSIEKSIQIAIGLEMDNLRSFILDQHQSMQKELFKLREKTKKQAEVTGYLFSVIDELVATNKKLISKHK